MRFFGIKDDELSYGLLIDVSSGSVGIAIAESDRRKDLPHLIYAERTHLRVSEHSTELSSEIRRAKEAMLASALTLSHEGMSKLREQNPKAEISHVFVTCSSPWSHTVARSVRYTEEEPFKVTKKVVDDLIKNAEKEILDHVVATTELGKQNFKVVEKATVDISVNDYAVKEPYGLLGKTLNISHVAGLIPNELLESVEEVQEKLFKSAELRAHTYMLVMYCVMRDIFPTIHSSCIIDITGEATEFGIVEQNLLIDNSYIPYGTNTIIRNVSKKLSVPEVDIRNQLIEYGQNKIADAIKEEVENYQHAVEMALNKILEKHVLPKNIILTSHSEFTSTCKYLFETIFEKIGGDQHTVLTVDSKMIDSISTGTEEDAYLAISARFFHKLHACTEIDGQ